MFPVLPALQHGCHLNSGATLSCHSCKLLFIYIKLNNSQLSQVAGNAYGHYRSRQLNENEWDQIALSLRAAGGGNDRVYVCDY